MTSTDTVLARQVSTIALLGNPNSGKSSIFNLLTGLQQKVGNFPGVTVEKKEGVLHLSRDQTLKVVDFPGTYSLYPNAEDERIVVDTFSNPNSPHYPDAIVYVADVTRLEKHLLLFTQLCDLELPMILALNMTDLARKKGLEVDTEGLSRRFGVPCICVSGRTAAGIETLKARLGELMLAPERFLPRPFYPLSTLERKAAEAVKTATGSDNSYQALLVAHHYSWLSGLSHRDRQSIGHALEEMDFSSLPAQVEETMDRYDRFEQLVRKHVRQPAPAPEKASQRLDAVLTHRIWGPLIFFLLMLMVFQAIFAWAELPMQWIEGLFGLLGQAVRDTLPAGQLTDLITDGLLAGLGGILIFIPQIAILFFLISLLEEVGYMARAAFLFDELMQRFGLNGRSIVALISGGACAVPAIMSTRTIGNWKERLITILVTPFISCSARIPVYTVLIGFVVPPTVIGGIFNLQGLAFMGLYLLGIAAALLSAWVFKLVLRGGQSSYLMLELPDYRLPVMRNVWLSVWTKVKTFVLEAGKIILFISLVLWVLANYGWGDQMATAEQQAQLQAQERELDPAATDNLIAAKRLEASFAGQLGRFIEPAIRPLGFDWKIGIALITSFAAREVFVGTMATIYSIGSESDEYRIRDRLAREVDPLTGRPIYNLATSLSLLLFYVFAMQCMSTLAVVKRETDSWKWPIVQFVFMTGMAYLASLLAYQLLA